MNTQDTKLLQEAIELSKRCPPSKTAFSVGAIIITEDGKKFTWYSRETWPIEHAEEVAIQKAQEAWASLVHAILYSSLEPCSERASKEKTCSQLIIELGFKKCVFAVLEDTRFVADCRGKENMENAWIEVIHLELESS